MNYRQAEKEKKRGEEKKQGGERMFLPKASKEKKVAGKNDENLREKGGDGGN